MQIDEVVKAIMANPLSGEPKTGALKGVRVEKFKAGPQQLLVAYTFTARTQTVEMLFDAVFGRAPGRLGGSLWIRT